MKLFTYTNRFKLIFDILFKPKLVQQEFNKFLRNERDSIIEQADDKLRMIGFEQYKKGVAVSERNTIHIMDMPIRGEERISESFESSTIVANMRTEKLQEIKVSYNSSLPIEEIKREAADRLGRHLIEKGILQSVVIPHENKIKFFIQAFGL